MPKQATERPMPGLRSVVDRRYADLLERSCDDITRQLQVELEAGATVEDIERFAKANYGDDWFAKRIVSAARHMAATIKERA